MLEVVTGAIHLPNQRCSFCGTPRREGQRMVSGPNVYICESCVRDAVQVVEGSVTPEPSPGA